jgi:hypothetical protein
MAKVGSRPAAAGHGRDVLAEQDSMRERPHACGEGRGRTQV